MSWTGHVACRERSVMTVGFWWEIQKKREHLEDLAVGRSTLLKLILE
jgi:hypothetical protein